MRRPITEITLKVLNKNEMLMKRLKLEKEDDLKLINPFKIMITAFKDWFFYGEKLIAKFEDAEKFEEQIKTNDPVLTENMRKQEKYVYGKFLKHIDYFYDKQKNIKNKIELYPHLKKEHRREDLDKYFIQEATKYTSPVYVFEGEKGELRLLQMYYAINYLMFEHMKFRGVAQIDVLTDPLQQEELSKEAHSWGRKEWVQMQVDKVEDEEMKQKLKEYKYQTYLFILFPQSGEIRLVSVDEGEITHGFGNIKLD